MYSNADEQQSVLYGSMRKLSTKLALAAISGVVVQFVLNVEILDFFDSYAFFYGMPGLAFALAVLFPYLRKDRFAILRGIGLIFVAIGSFSAALTVALSVPSIDSGGLFDIDWRVFVPGVFVGSVVGAIIVLIGTSLVAPLAWTNRFLWYGLPASIVAGLPFILDSIVSEYVQGDSPFVTILPHSIWHVTMAMVIHFACVRK